MKLIFFRELCAMNKFWNCFDERLTVEKSDFYKPLYHGHFIHYDAFHFYSKYILFCVWVGFYHALMCMIYLFLSVKTWVINLLTVPEFDWLSSNRISAIIEIHCKEPPQKMVF